MSKEQKGDRRYFASLITISVLGNITGFFMGNAWTTPKSAQLYSSENKLPVMSVKNGLSKVVGDTRLVEDPNNNGTYIPVNKYLDGLRSDKEDGMYKKIQEQRTNIKDYLSEEKARILNSFQR